MKYECDLIRDLLPLYADNACSETSREMIEEHLSECADCRDLATRLLKTEIEDELSCERESVIDYGVRAFRKRTAIIGSAVSGAVTIPVLVIAIMSLFARPSLSWVSIVTASLIVAASFILVPILVPEDKAFWTFCAFCASLMLLLGVVCMYVHGSWFWIASSASLFGLSVVFLPFLLRSRPLRRLVEGRNRLLIILGVDAALFFNMMNMIVSRGRLTISSLLFLIGILGGIAAVFYAVFRKGFDRK